MTIFNQVTILGSGTSTGVPMIGCQCAVCASSDVYNQRLRASIFMQTKSNKKILVDTSSDMRTQLLKNKVEDLDAALITHSHADHIGGLDDVRAFCFKYQKKFPLFCSKKTITDLTERFPYIFNFPKNKPVLGGGIPEVELFELGNGVQKILDEEFTIYQMPHGHTQTIGFIHHQFAYFIDCHSIPDVALKEMKNRKLDWLIIDCVRRKPHQTHLHLDLALQYIDFIEPQNAGLTHLSHDFDHHDLTRELRAKNFPHVVPVYDGQIITYR